MRSKPRSHRTSALQYTINDHEGIFSCIVNASCPCLTVSAVLLSHVRRHVRRLPLGARFCLSLLSGIGGATAKSRAMLKAWAWKTDTFSEVSAKSERPPSRLIPFPVRSSTAIAHACALTCTLHVMVLGATEGKGHVTALCHTVVRFTTSEDYRAFSTQRMCRSHHAS